MASVAPILDRHGSGESDYGSDFSVGEEDIVNQLLQDLGSKTASPTHPTSTASSPALPLEPQDRHHSPDLRIRSESALPGKAKATAVLPTTIQSAEHATPSIPFSDVQYPDISHALSTVRSKVASGFRPVPVELEKDSQSPLQRFRSFPKKPLTVSDLASGAWCELQYWYTLTLLPGGRKTRTTAMRGGTRVHQTLEDEVHTTVQVTIATKEEAFALRLWNAIQGLRTLRDTGMTRELEVWGMIEGQIINGIIDEVSHESPNAAFEQELNLSQSSQGFLSTRSNPQAPITDYLEPHGKRFYLTDVKTRASDRLPTGAALRPARVQLFLYHRLLGDMASGMVDFNAISDRYGLRTDAIFSDAFMAQIGNLHDEIFYDADSDLGQSPSTPHSARDERDATGSSDTTPSRSSEIPPPHDLIGYRSIAQILPLLQSELRETFPRGPASLGNLLAVQYRHRDDGRVLGNNAFPNDPEALDAYIKQNLQWWRGERDADGVSIEETYKCRSCEFAEGCQWRKDKEAEFLQKKRSHTRVRG
ncbi:exonuclease V [Hypoxylon cercidicola]|nr:exonuclease V [Hypoxylon cercidicola]